jgi:hypothetical protein
MSFNNIKMISQPDTLDVKLFPHQLALIHNMEELEMNNVIIKDEYVKVTKMGINADLTGSGKTLEMIGLILRDKMKWDINMPFIFEKIISTSNNRINNYFTYRYVKLPTTLIVVSPTIIEQWEKDLSHSTLKYNKITCQKNIDTIKIDDYDVILVTPNIYNNLINKYSDYAWKRFIYDEPGNIKINKMKEIQSNFYWFISSNPNSIKCLYNKSKDNFMHNLFCNDPLTTVEEEFSDIIVRNNTDFIKQSFKIAEINYYYHYCYEPIYNAIEKFVNVNIKEMLSSGNIEGAILALGGEKVSNLIELVRKNKEIDLFNIECKIRNSKNEEDKNKFLHEKKEVENDIQEINIKFNNMLKNPCSICHDNLKSPILEPSCQNMFCGECFLKWYEKNHSCPLCRSNINMSKVIYIENTNNNDNIIPKEKLITKTNKIIDIIKNKKDGKFLIFSDYDKSFIPICYSLEENDINFLQIKSNTKNINKNLELFKKGTSNVIFINNINNTAGINLQEITDIILYHEIKKDVEKQIIGRANRIGKDNELNIHYLKIDKELSSSKY